MVKRLDKNEIQQRLTAPWRLCDQKLCRRLRFASFVDAIAFIQAVAVVAEELNHHPDWSNCYRQVAIALTTHSCQGLSSLDFDLAEAIDSILDQSFPTVNDMSVDD